MLSTVFCEKSYEIFPKHNGDSFISESFFFQLIDFYRQTIFQIINNS